MTGMTRSTPSSTCWYMIAARCATAKSPGEVDVHVVAGSDEVRESNQCVQESFAEGSIEVLK